MSKKAAQKIIDGLKEAAKSAKCDHDWEFRDGTTAFAGKPMKRVYVCPYCGVRKTEFGEDQSR